MFLKTIAALFLSAITSSCIIPAKEPAAAFITMHGDPAFTTQEREAISHASHTWRLQTGGQAEIRVIYDMDPLVHALEPTIVRANTNDPVIQAEDCEIQGLPPEDFAGYCQPSLLGYVSPSGGMHNPWNLPYKMVLIPERYESHERFVSVTLHEMGHLFGIPHQESVQSVMFYAQLEEPKTCLRQADLKAFCNNNVCDDREMFPCETNKGFRL